MIVSALALAFFAAAAAPATQIPVIYTTDLYHPHDDPDDHVDLLTLFALPEFDIRAIIIDMGERGKGRPGIPALHQGMHLAGRKVPHATGLEANLKSPGDGGADQPDSAQGGIALILETLKQAGSPVTIIAAGSLRDVAAAFNRDPGLFRAKVGRLYVNAGHSGGEDEWNVTMDPVAYVRILTSGLPIYWIPCFGVDGYASFWKFTQGDVYMDAPRAVRNFMVYALTKQDPASGDPVAFLDSEPGPEVLDPIYAAERNMWCTGPFLHAAGRTAQSCSFKEVTVSINEQGRTSLDPAGSLHLNTFHIDDPSGYTAEMTSMLKTLLSSIGGIRE